MAKFEAHVTCDRSQSLIVQKVADSIGWTFSAIDGDPIMGKQAYCYLTAYDTSGHALMVRMLNEVRPLLDRHGVEPLRFKIEEIVYDSKTGVNTLGV